MRNERDIRILLHRISDNGDEIAFQELFELYVHGILRFSNSILRSKELSEEAVSDVFFNLWTHRAKLAKIENIKAYIYTSARNTSLNYLSKERREKAISLEDISVSLPINEICPESVLISKELKEAIGRAIDHLPERCKLIYSLAKIEQLKYKEIAQILDISVKTIDHQLTIAIKKIGEEIQVYLSEPPASDKYTVLLHLFLPK
ncbi:MAG: RNA polymerase sigma-70 factor [Bacteroidia bacterium]